MSPRPKTWMTTVSTIKGAPHAQSADQAIGLTARKLQAAWAILIETSFNRSLGTAHELLADVTSACYRHTKGTRKFRNKCNSSTQDIHLIGSGPDIIIVLVVGFEVEMLAKR